MFNIQWIPTRISSPVIKIFLQIRWEDCWGAKEAEGRVSWTGNSRDLENFPNFWKLSFYCISLKLCHLSDYIHTSDLIVRLYIFLLKNLKNLLIFTDIKDVVKREDDLELTFTWDTPRRTRRAARRGQLQQIRRAARDRGKGGGGSEAATSSTRTSRADRRRSSVSRYSGTIFLVSKTVRPALYLSWLLTWSPSRMIICNCQATATVIGDWGWGWRGWEMGVAYLHSQLLFFIFQLFSPSNPLFSDLLY